MAKGKKSKFPKLPRGVKVLIWIFGILLLSMSASLYLWVRHILMDAPQSLNGDPPAALVRIGNPFNKSSESFVFNGCGSLLPNYKYSIKLPSNWNITKRDYNEVGVYFDTFGDGKNFTLSCTTQGIGGGCDSQYRTDLVVNDKKVQACLGFINGKWELSDTNLGRNPSDNTIISFWAEGIDKDGVQNILSTFKIIGD